MDKIYPQRGSLDGRRAETAPPLFDGRLMLTIVMATSVWGPMRLGEIEALIGKKYHSSRTGQAARMLQDQGICICSYRGKRNIRVELDRRHPMFIPIRRLGRKLYAHYIEPTASALPIRRAKQIRYNIPAFPKLEASSLNMHVFGDRPQVRVLHLLAESGSLPAFMITRLLGTSHAIYSAIRELENIGIVRTRRKGVDLYVRLNRQWHAAEELRLLLKSLNRHLPEYAAMAAVHRRRRKLHQYTWTLRLRRGLGRCFVRQARRDIGRVQESD